jgi:hypothetical protein
MCVAVVLQERLLMYSTPASLALQVWHQKIVQMELYKCGVCCQYLL